jgi:hypothetical protein
VLVWRGSFPGEEILKHTLPRLSLAARGFSLVWDLAYAIASHSAELVGRTVNEVYLGKRRWQVRLGIWHDRAIGEVGNTSTTINVSE